MNKILVSLFTVAASAITLQAQNIIETYTAPDGAPLNNDFSVQVRVPGGEWRSIPTYMVLVDEVRNATHHFEDSSVAFFDFEGQVDVKVISNGAPITSARVRPFSYGIEPVLEGNELTFSLCSPKNLSVEVNGDIFHNLQLFASPLCKDKPDAKRIKKDKDLIYFGPGYYDLGPDGLTVGSGKTVYVDGGAFIKGTIKVEGAEGVRVYGHGLLRPERGAGVLVSRSRDVVVEGVIVTQCPVCESDGVKVIDVKSITNYGWGDGMNVIASSNVLFDGVFCRNSDDCTTVYATRGEYSGSCRNIVMQNSTLWADVAHPIFIGIHGNADNPDTIENCRYYNIDILDQKEKQLNYQGCLAINGGDNNIIRDITFENIRIEDIREGQLCNFRIFFNRKYCKAPGQCINDILIKDVTYTGDNANVSIISGYDATRKISGVTFQNLKINGVVISDDMEGKPAWYQTGDIARIYVGEHVDDVKFIK